jgi:hypothetical protein
LTSRLDIPDEYDEVIRWRHLAIVVPIASALPQYGDRLNTATVCHGGVARVLGLMASAFGDHDAAFTARESPYLVVYAWRDVH